MARFWTKLTLVVTVVNGQPHLVVAGRSPVVRHGIQPDCVRQRLKPLLQTIMIVTVSMLLTGCRPAPVVQETAADISQLAQPTAAVAATALSTSLPQASATPLPATAVPPTATPLPTATLTPLPPVILALTTELQAAAEQALARLQSEAPSGTTGRQWTITTNDDPAAVSAAGAAQMALIHNGAGTIVHQEPLVLAIPFTTNWEATSQADAETILANGHKLVTLLPWSAMTPDLKALRIDGRHPTDADYPFQDTWSLVAAPGYETAAAELASHLTAALASEPVVHLAAVGDIMLDRSLGWALSQGNLEYPFLYVADRLQVADYTVGNFESAMGTVGEPAPKHYPFRSPPEAAASLALAGFDLVSLANNHGEDYGPDALIQALELLQAQNVAAIGAGPNDAAAHAAHIAEVNGLKLGFLGYVHVPVEATTNFDVQTWTATADAPGLAWGDPQRIRGDVAALRSQVDLVIVLLHSGYEYIEEPSEPQVLAAKAAVDAGADLVIGHHAHILQGIERYNGGVIAYGLGNFVFEIDGPPETAILNVWLGRDGVRQLELLPALIQFGGQPRLAESWEAAPILQRVYSLTTLLNRQRPEE